VQLGREDQKSPARGQSGAFEPSRTWRAGDQFRLTRTLLFFRTARDRAYRPVPTAAKPGNKLSNFDFRMHRVPNICFRSNLAPLTPSKLERFHHVVAARFKIIIKMPAVMQQSRHAAGQFQHHRRAARRWRDRIGPVAGSVGGTATIAR
jgi:hypothetical protein